MKPSASPVRTATWRSSTSLVSPVAELTGTGTESSTVTPASAGRSTATFGWSTPEMRRALTLAETSTPSSGASTVAPRSANCWKAMLWPGGHMAQANASGAAVASGEPRMVEASARWAAARGKATSSAARALRGIVMPLMRASDARGSLIQTSGRLGYFACHASADGSRLEPAGLPAVRAHPQPVLGALEDRERSSGGDGAGGASSRLGEQHRAARAGVHDRLAGPRHVGAYRAGGIRRAAQRGDRDAARFAQIVD